MATLTYKGKGSGRNAAMSEMSVWSTWQDISWNTGWQTKRMAHRS